MKVEGSFTMVYIKDDPSDCYEGASSKLLNHSVPGACVKSGIIYVKCEIVNWHFSKL